MEDIDKNEVSDNGISEDEDLMMREGRREAPFILGLSGPLFVPRL